MSRSTKAMLGLAVVLLGLWGCTKAPANRSNLSERLRVLEARCARLEQDYRTVAAARDQMRKQLEGAQTENGQLKKEVEDNKGLEQEKEELRRQVANLTQQLAQRTSERDEARSVAIQRTGERDALQSRFGRVVESVSRQMQQMQTLLSDMNSPMGTQLPETMPQADDER